MSATSFERHRRATAVTYISGLLNGRHKARVADIMLEHGVTPDQLGNLAGNSVVRTIADQLAAEHLHEPELDQLEELNVLDVGDRAAVHSADVRDDQFQDEMQHPCQETVGVGNMHDAPAVAAETLANVSSAQVDAAGGLAAAAQAKARGEDPLAEHSDLPPPLTGDGTHPVITDPTTGQPVPHPMETLPAGAPTPLPAAEHQITAEDDAPTDPEGANEGSDTVVDINAAAEELAAAEKQGERMEKLGEASLRTLKRDKLLEYAENQRITLTDVRPRTTLDSIVAQILDAQGAE